MSNRCKYSHVDLVDVESAFAFQGDRIRNLYNYDNIRVTVTDSDGQKKDMVYRIKCGYCDQSFHVGTSARYLRDKVIADANFRSTLKSRVQMHHKIWHGDLKLPSDTVAHATEEIIAIACNLTELMQDP